MVKHIHRIAGHLLQAHRNIAAECRHKVTLLSKGHRFRHISFAFLSQPTEYTTKIWCTTKSSRNCCSEISCSFCHFSHLNSATRRWDALSACLCLLLSEYFGLILHHGKKVLFNVCHWQPFSFPTHPFSAGKHITHANTPTGGERDGQFEPPVLFPNL